MRCVEPMDANLMMSLLEDFRFVDICFVIIPILPEKKPNTSQGPRKELLVVSATFYLFASFSVLNPNYANPKNSTCINMKNLKISGGLSPCLIKDWFNSIYLENLKVQL